MLVRALSGRPLVLPLWHRVRAVWMPTLGSAPLVATTVLRLGREALTMPGGTTRGTAHSFVATTTSWISSPEDRPHHVPK